MNHWLRSLLPQPQAEEGAAGGFAPLCLVSLFFLALLPLLTLAFASPAAAEKGNCLSA